MSTQTLPRRWLSAAAGSNKLVSAAGSVARLIRLRLNAWRDRRKLQALPDYLLADMGLSRGEIEGAVRFGRNCPIGVTYRI